MNLKLALLLLGLIGNAFLYSQNGPELIPGEMVVQFESKEDFQKYSLQQHPGLTFSNLVSDYMQLYFYKYDPDEVNGSALTTTLNKHPLIKRAGQNFKTSFRETIPSDDFFNEQESLNLIQAPDAWDITTSAPEELVVAVIEGGDIEHEDIRDNIWTNSGEIPDDGIDNDNNGYIDDYFGVNVVDSTDTPIKNDHSTSVAGIVGAQGDNGIGVTGVLWDVNMMIVSHDLTFVKIIESYDYIYQIRKKYNDTNGAEGAFVVVTNSSFGVNDADPYAPNANQLFPVWCESYDMMGSVGILSATATNNSKVNIDLQGDMPCLCNSDYLIAVTNTNLNDELIGGFGRENIDLSAPGRSSYTTKPNNDYGNFNGTSAATPHVTGAIGMLYSFPCEGFLEQSLSTPSQIALQVKQVLLDNTDQIDELTDRSVSGGRLNVFKALQAMQGLYGAPIGDLGFINIYPNPVGHNELLKVEYQTSETSEYEVKVYDSIGRLLYVHIVPELCAPRVIEIPTGRLGTGMHFLSIENNNNIESSRFWVY